MDPNRELKKYRSRLENASLDLMDALTAANKEAQRIYSQAAEGDLENIIRPLTKVRSDTATAQRSLLTIERYIGHIVAYTEIINRQTENENESKSN